MRDISLGETIDFKFTTTEPDTGAPATLSGTPVISAYVGNGTTEITAGITLTVDFDGRTGLNNVRVVASGGNGYTDNTDVSLIITTGTVDGVSAVGYKVAEFTIGRAAAYTRLGAPAGASVSADIAAIEAQTDDIGAAGAGLTAITNLLPAALVGGRIDASVGAVANNAITAAAIATGAIDADAIADNAIDAGAIASNAITLAKIATDAREALGGVVTSGTLSGTHSDTTADLGTNAPSADITGQTLFFPDHDLSRAIESYNTGTGVATFDSIGVTLANGNTWHLFATTPASAGGGPSAADIADAVWDEAQAGHVSAGSFGEIATEIAVILVDTAEIGAAGAGLTALATQASVDTIDNFLDTEVAAILADTNELQTDWANGGRLDLILDARASQTSVDDLPTNAELATALAAADDAILAAIAALNNLSAAEVNAEVLDVLNVDTFAQPGQGAPAATTTLSLMLRYLYKAWRNRSTQTASEYALYADDGTTKDQEAAVSDNGTTLDRGEVTTGA